MNSIELTSKDGQVSVADPNLLFPRMLSVLLMGKDDALKLEEVFRHELCPFPPTLFDSVDLLKGSNKSELAKAIQEQVQLLGTVQTLQHILSSMEACCSSKLNGVNYLHLR